MVGIRLAYSNPLKRYENLITNIEVLPNVRFSLQNVFDIDAEKPLLELRMSRQLRPLPGLPLVPIIYSWQSLPVVLRPVVP